MRLATIADRLEERFVRPMALDGLCALIEPAMEQAPALLDQDPVIPLEEALRSEAATPTGVGLDVPHWILRLEGEVHRVRTRGPPWLVSRKRSFRSQKLRSLSRTWLNSCAIGKRWRSRQSGSKDHRNRGCREATEKNLSKNTSLFLPFGAKLIKQNEPRMVCPLRGTVCQGRQKCPPHI